MKIEVDGADSIAMPFKELPLGSFFHCLKANKYDLCLKTDSKEFYSFKREVFNSLTNDYWQVIVVESEDITLKIK